MEKINFESYNARLNSFRDVEWPSLRGTVYLDHAGTTPPAKSLIDRFAADITSSLYGNPHSGSPSSQLSTLRTEDVRIKVLEFFQASLDDFDVVFVANATAGIKLVVDAFSGHDHGFWYGYHEDSHTSLIGAREIATAGNQTFTDEQVEKWLNSKNQEDSSENMPLSLFAFPAQSNMNGRRLPLDWCRRIREISSKEKPCYSLLDAAALVSTAPLDLSDSSSAADFTVLSFYKIFGLPDLGAIIVRKPSAGVLHKRKYFGGGTVDLVTCIKEQWHVNKSDSIHASLEDGTLPVHNILALDHAIEVHHSLFGPMGQVSQHTTHLALRLFEGLRSLNHGNGVPVCEIYKHRKSTYEEPGSQGPVVAFNIRNSQGAWLSNTEIEKLASVRNIHFRSGGLCNPGGIARSLDLHAWELKRNFSAGHRCGSENDIINGKPTGVLRVSVGAMSTLQDIEHFLEFVREFFVQDGTDVFLNSAEPEIEHFNPSDFSIESLTIYPIKSCAGWNIPANMSWQMRPHGLAWDREWALLHRGSGTALSQKKFPRMALIRPSIDLARGILQVRFGGHLGSFTPQEIAVPLSEDPTYFVNTHDSKSSAVCGDETDLKIYASSSIEKFLTAAIGTPCRLARLPAGSTSTSQRRGKAQLQQHQQISVEDVPELMASPPILLSNESPILLISRSSLNRLNEQIKQHGGKAAKAEVFRANIVVAQDQLSIPGTEMPYIEDYWRLLKIGAQLYRVMGSCRRCQMVCIDQETAEKNEEPFITLARTRRFNGKVWFGQHLSPVRITGQSSISSQGSTIKVGDSVNVLQEGR